MAIDSRFGGYYVLGLSRIKYFQHKEAHVLGETRLIKTEEIKTAFNRISKLFPSLFVCHTFLLRHSDWSFLPTVSSGE